MWRRWVFKTSPPIATPRAVSGRLQAIVRVIPRVTCWRPRSLSVSTGGGLAKRGEFQRPPVPTRLFELTEWVIGWTAMLQCAVLRVVAGCWFEPHFEDARGAPEEVSAFTGGTSWSSQLYPSRNGPMDPRGCRYSFQGLVAKLAEFMGVVVALCIVCWVRRPSLLAGPTLWPLPGGQLAEQFDSVFDSCATVIADFGQSDFARPSC